MKIIFESEKELSEFINDNCPSLLDFEEHKNCGDGAGIRSHCQECWEQCGLEYEIKNEQSTVKDFTLNLNDMIKVKLTDYGKDVYYHKNDDLISKGVPIERYHPRVDDEGYTDIQLWQFMKIFGPAIKFGMPEQIIENNTIYIKEESIEMTNLKDFYTLPFIDLVYETVRFETLGLDSIYKDYIINLVGITGLNALIEHKLVEGCGIVNGRKLYVLCDRSERK